MNTAFDAAAWSTFFSALVSAGAALTGLLFVSISINLRRILDVPVLVARAGKALATAMLLPLVAVLCLVPAQPPVHLGWQMLGVGSLGSAGILFLHTKAMYRNHYLSKWQKLGQAVVLIASTLPYVAAGCSLVLGRGGGLYWAADGAFASLMAPVIDAWVLMIEIQR